MDDGLDVDLAREVIILKARALGLGDDMLEELDDTVCAMLGIDDPDPFIFPD